MVSVWWLCRPRLEKNCMTSHVKVMVIFGGSLGEVMSSSVAGSEILSPVALFSLYYTVQQSGCLGGTVG